MVAPSAATLQSNIIIKLQSNKTIYEYKQKIDIKNDYINLAGSKIRTLTQRWLPNKTTSELSYKIAKQIKVDFRHKVGLPYKYIPIYNTKRLKELL